ncbi:diaminopropionate ammonia-lyase [Caproiciproducens sp. R2]|uniref:diaminopropionate ammonia-lyase n=1 Tax=Caproiciproducens sp. R2 TaxID=3435187 RepID=UPI0040338A50
MNECFKSVHWEHPEEGKAYSVERFGVAHAKDVNSFHKSFPEYSVTPLVELCSLAKQLGLGDIWVKDESFRFGLNAFKVLGGSYAIGRYLSKRLGVPLSQLPYERMTSDKVKQKLGSLTFVTATDGNHGRGVAWTANRLGQKSVVYMPQGSAQERLENIRALGSEASITDLNYDDAVRLANENAEKYGWIMVQDTSWEGYEDIPGWIMEGYTTMAYEAAQQLREQKPTHIFLQAGVGAMSGGVTGFFADLYKDDPHPPIITIVEPNQADCLYRTAYANDGRLHFVKGEMHTIMAGLACGEPCTIGWQVLRDHADNFVSMPDYVAAKGMRILGNPLPGDTRIISGESGASTLGLVAELMQNSSLGWLRDQLKIDASSKVLCFSTEGDTDKDGYRNIVWDGKHSSFE